MDGQGIRVTAKRGAETEEPQLVGGHRDGTPIQTVAMNKDPDTLVFPKDQEDPPSACGTSDESGLRWGDTKPLVTSRPFLSHLPWPPWLLCPSWVTMRTFRLGLCRLTKYVPAGGRLRAQPCLPSGTRSSTS